MPSVYLNFPLLIQHIRREARFFIAHLKRLQKRESLTLPGDHWGKVFWDRIIRTLIIYSSLADPSETTLIMTAEDFTRSFKLESRAKDVKDRDMKARVPRL